MAAINREEVVARLGGDEELYAQICGLFRRDGRMLLERLQGALDAGSLELAVRYAQSIKSMASNVGAEELMALAAQAEKAGRDGDGVSLGACLPQLELQLFSVLQELPAQPPIAS